MSVAINKITNANAYLGGNSLLGKVEEADLPKIVQKMTEYKALGMIADLELPSGIEKLEARIKWKSYFSDVFRRFANPFSAIEMQLRGNLESYTSGGRSGEVPYVVYMTVYAKDLPLGNFKKHENVEMESNLSVTYVKLEVDGEPVVELDVIANIYKVDGVDIMAQYKANTGA
jgi:P2 family phage contractile tail tube protein